MKIDPVGSYANLNKANDVKSIRPAESNEVREPDGDRDDVKVAANTAAAKRMENDSGLGNRIDTTA